MKVLFAGLGSVGQRHLRNLLRQTDVRVEILAFRSTRATPLLETNDEVVRDVDVAAHYGIETFNDLDEALRRSPDIAFITNPNSYHIPVATAAAKAGCDLFIEKPLSHNMLGACELLEIVRKRELIVGLGHQYRFHPGVVRAKQWLDEGRIGAVVSASFVNGEYIPAWHPWEDYRESYGARSDLGGGAISSQIHEYDLAYWMFGLPTSVFAVGGHLSSLDLDVEDSATALFGVPITGRIVPVDIHLDYLQAPPVRKFTIVGDRGRIIWHEQEKSTTLHLIDREEVACERFEDFNRNNMFVEMLTDFLTAVATRRSPMVDLAAGIQSLKMADAAKSSMISEEKVTLSPRTSV